MGTARTTKDEDRLFIRHGRRSYRRRFSRREAQWGIAVLVVLAAVAVWVLWKGAHPDPALFAAGFEPGVAATASGAAGASSADPAPFPAGLAPQGWVAGAVEHFDPSNLYVKIDGREDFYKSYGFRALHWVSLHATDDPATTVDIELFDLGSAANALGAYTAERAPDATPQVTESGMWHRARNASFATVGRFYARLVGSDESAPVLEAVEHVRTTLAATLPAESLPWGYALFAGALGLDAGQVNYTAENAYSFGFARQVYAASLDDADLEGFVTVAADPGAASALAARFVAGFGNYGEDAGLGDDPTWIRDRYLGTLSTAMADGSWVVGVRGAVDATQGAAALARLHDGLRALPPEVAARARSASTVAQEPEAPGDRAPAESPSETTY